MRPIVDSKSHLGIEDRKLVKTSRTSSARQALPTPSRDLARYTGKYRFANILPKLACGLGEVYLAIVIVALNIRVRGIDCGWSKEADDRQNE